MSPAYTSTGSLAGLTGLPKFQIVHPEHAPVSYMRASGAIDPGDVVEALGEGQGKTYYEVGGKVRKIVTMPTDTAGKRRYGVASRQVEPMLDANAASLTDGPIEIVNQEIASGEFLRIWYEGTFFTTKMNPNDSPFIPGEMVTYDPDEDRPADMTGTGSWVRTTDAAAAIGEIVSFKEVGDSGYAEIRIL